MCVFIVFSQCHVLEWRAEGDDVEDIPQYKFLKPGCFTDLFTGAVK